MTHRSNQHSGRSRFCDGGFLVAAIALTALCVSSSARAQDGARAFGPSDWMRLAPGSTRLYIEVHDLDSIRQLFERVGIWRAVQELGASRSVNGEAGQPLTTLRPERSDLTSDSAITRVLGRRAALLSSSVSAWQNGLVFAELPDSSELTSVLRTWSARSRGLADGIERYSLPGGVDLAVKGRMLVFGPAGDPDGMWKQAVSLMSGAVGSNLAGRSDVASLRARMSGDYSGLIYAAWSDESPATSRPSVRTDRMLVGFRVSAHGVECDIHEQRRLSDSAPTSRCLSPASLPASTIAYWSGTLDPTMLARPEPLTRANPDNSLADFIIGFLFRQGRSDSAADWLVGPQYLLVLDSDRQTHEKRFQLPELSLICRASDPAAAVDRIDLIAPLAVDMAVRMSGGAVRSPSSMDRSSCEGVDIHAIDLRPRLVGPSSASPLAAMSLCWARLDDRVILSTSRRHIVSIIRADRGRKPKLGREGDENAAESAMVRGRVASSMIDNDMQWLSRFFPDMLEARWWESWAEERVANRSRLGIGLKDLPGRPGDAVVTEVNDLSPARSLLWPGDVVVATGGQALTSASPAREIAERYRLRGAAREFPMTVERAGRRLEVRILVQPDVSSDLVGFDPPEAVRQVSGLLRQVRSLRYVRFEERATGATARVRLEWADAPLKD